MMESPVIEDWLKIDSASRCGVVQYIKQICLPLSLRDSNCDSSMIFNLRKKQRLAPRILNGAMNLVNNGKDYNVIEISFKG